MSFLKPFFQISKATLKSLMWLIWTIRIAMLAGFIFVVVCIVAFATQPSLPEPQDAPFGVVAVTTDNLSRHVYYARVVLDDGSKLIMVDYWQCNGKKYSLTKGEKPLVKADWGEIRIFGR